MIDPVGSSRRINREKLSHCPKSSSSYTGNYRGCNPNSPVNFKLNNLIIGWVNTCVKCMCSLNTSAINTVSIHALHINIPDPSSG